MQFPTLRAEMARRGIQRKDIAEALGLCRKTVDKKITGKTEFTANEMVKVRDTLFPSMTVGYLFFNEAVYDARIKPNVIPMFKR